jgi:hypothetical protein
MYHNKSLPQHDIHATGSQRFGARLVRLGTTQSCNLTLRGQPDSGCQSALFGVRRTQEGEQATIRPANGNPSIIAESGFFLDEKDGSLMI